MRSLTVAALGLGIACRATAQVEAVWLSYRSATPDRTAVSWKTLSPGPSCVRYGPDAACRSVSSLDEAATLHHVEIPTPDPGATVFYRVETGSQSSEVQRFTTPPSDGLRVAVIGDWGYAGHPDLRALKADRPHLLLTAGDNVAQMTNPEAAGDVSFIQPFVGMLRSEQELFASTPFMPILGNHDKQVGPRTGKRAGSSAEVYDVAATAYLSVFALPSPGWRWSFTVPQADVTFLALDIQHVSDFGTTFQTCHDFRRGSEQFNWYDAQTRAADTGFVVTLMNEQSRFRDREGGAWHEMFSRGSICITGFGYFAERAMAENGFAYYNTCVAKAGDIYRDPRAVICEAASNYMLLTFDRAAGHMTVELKRLDGSVIDRQVFAPRTSSGRR